MFKIKLAAAVVVAALAVAPVAALAEASQLQLVVGGEAYDGPPKFEVSFDGEVIGEAAVAAAIDTATVGRFAAAADKAAHVQSFEFVIPEERFSPGGEVRVRLINEAYGGDGSDRDRNLYLASIAVNGQAVTVSGLTTATADGSKDNEVLGEFLVLADGNVAGVSTAPAGGWPVPADAAVAAAVEVPEAVPATVTQAVAVVPAEAAAPLKAPAVVADLAVPAAEPLQTASIDQDPEASACGRDELYNVIGFNENSNDLTPKLMERLDQIAADIGTEKCTVLITGFSSVQGDYATNALFAVERAQNVLTYLRTKGLAFAESSATGAGETTEFGELPSANRRVVISVRP
jgi:outer membrane protein OmpA-like peptidoglycan-associated protein